MFPLKESFMRELEEIKARLAQEIRFKAAEFKELIELSSDDLDENVCPLIVLAVNRSFGGNVRPAVSLATVVQYIFMADQVHHLMNDSLDLEEGKRQFPVLVGDFLYGKFFLSLCKGKLLHFLSPLAGVIATMNQGAISRWLGEKGKIGESEHLKILEMERASLTGQAARLSAELAGCSEKDQNRCEALGWELGVAWAAWRDQMGKKAVRQSLDRAKQILMELPENEVIPLYELYHYMERSLGEAV
ncbi:geranylgeranyl pyrophosphate synthase [Desulfitobacterium sp. Sab5]|uniref:geranylgeranyl pyrophosphate synthase n=1 Tax=Desulfitobacterium TaxID=36853 RepID=UPI003CF1631C